MPERAIECRNPSYSGIDTVASHPRRHLTRRLTTGAALLLSVAMGAVATQSAHAADAYQRGSDPSVTSVAATNGPFATTSTTVSAGNGFNGGTIYYPTDTSLGTWGAVAIVPGYSALFSAEEAWMGPRLASFGFVVFGIETSSRTDGAAARTTEVLAALDYLTQKSAVSSRVDRNRLAVMGHSAGGAGILGAASQRSSLKAAVGLAPGAPGTVDVSKITVPTLVIGGQSDPTVTPSYLDNLYGGLPATTPSAYVQLSGADHLYFTRANNNEIRRIVPWLKVFLDNDTRYTQFMCPALKDTTGVSKYSAKCALIPGSGSSSATSSRPSGSASHS